MPRNESNRRYLTFCEFSLGPLRWRSTSVQESEESNGGEIDTHLKKFVECLQRLIQQARKEGCTPQELDTILRQHTLGDHHVDA